jgi:hypothetical protein
MGHACMYARVRNGAVLVGANFPATEFWWEPISLLQSFGGSQFTKRSQERSNSKGCRRGPAQCVKLSIRIGRSAYAPLRAAIYAITG